MRPALTWSLILVLAVCAFAWPVTERHLLAAGILMRLADPNSKNLIVRFERHNWMERPFTVHSERGPVPARLYLPRHVKNAPAVVLLHGVHHLGMDEPRLVNFSRSLAQAGMVVLTPQLQDLADYRITPETLPVIAAAAAELHHDSGRKVGVVGLSFAGGLALMAAAEPRYATDISYVVAIGAHDQMQRVSQYFVDDSSVGPDGKHYNIAAHEYGPLVLVYQHPEDFFPVRDVPAARDALRLWLWEQPDKARLAEAKTGAATRAELESLFKHDRSIIRQQLEASIAKHRDEMAAVSPDAVLPNIHVPVLLLHGAADDVIPPTETEWLAKRIPRDELRAELISRAVSHVELQGHPGWRDEFDAVHFVARWLATANQR